MNGNRKYLFRTILISSAIVGGSLLNINSASAAPGPKPIVKAAPPPPPAPAPKPAPIPVLIAKPTPQPIPTPASATPPATVTQLPSFMSWTATPAPASQQLPRVNNSQPTNGDSEKTKSQEVFSKVAIVLGLTVVGLLAVAPISTGAAVFGISAAASGVASTVAYTSGTALAGNYLGIASIVSTLIAIKLND